MKKSLCLILILALIWVSLPIGYAQAVNEEKAGYLIIFQNFCLIVKSAKQFTSVVGRSDLGVILSDKTTHIFIIGNYLAIATPLSKLQTAIKKYHLENFTFIE